MVALLVVFFITTCLVVDSIQLHYATHGTNKRKPMLIPHHGI